MSQQHISQGVTLQNTNNELVKFIEELRTRRETINREIKSKEEDKNKLETSIRQLQQKLNMVNESLQRKVQMRQEYDKTLHETEAAYKKILESSRTLLTVLKREAVNLSKKSNPERM